MATLKCRQCGEAYSSCSDALINKEYKSFCCSEECYKAYIKIVLENRTKEPVNNEKQNVVDDKNNVDGIKSNKPFTSTKK
jgi:hypothetical protein